MNGKFIIIEGNIGAGKSTLAKALSAELGGTVQLEPAEGTNPYLPLYYSDPSRYSFVMQVFLLHKRLRAHKEAQALCLGERRENVVADRSFWGDLCFAIVQKELGYFSETDFETYTALHKDMQENLLYPSAVIHLKTTPETCAERVNRRLRAIKGRECEAGIELDYLERLNRQINAMIEGFARVCPVLPLDPLTAEGAEKSIGALVGEVVSRLNQLESAGGFNFQTWQGVGGFSFAA